MANITAKDVAELRAKTGCGMMECKKALVEAEGDMEKAVVVLREKGLAAAAKRADRIAAEGLVVSVVDEAKKAGVILEVNSETDFVARNEQFIGFVNAVAHSIIDQNPADVDELVNVPVSGGEGTVGELLTQKISTIGENIKIRRFQRFDGVLTGYVHGEGRIGVLVKLNTDLDAAVVARVGKDIALQITASTPAYLNREAVPAEVIEQEKEILTQQAINEGKPANIAEKMVAGRIQKYYKEFCLLDQPFVKDPDIAVSQYVANTAKELGGNIEIAAYVRYERGEGLEKRSDNFADEVANMVK